MNTSISIREVAVYHPEAVVSNDYFIEHFNKQGVSITNLLNALGRENRYIAGKNETSVSMAVEASKKALQQANLKGEDLDMIVFCSGTPEYLYPPNSILIHKEVQGKSNTIVYDSNVACVGMVVALDQVARYMQMNPNVKYALIVGAEQWHRFTREDNAPTHAGFGDAACAIVLEKTEEADRGLIDSSYFTFSGYDDRIMFPACGLSNVYNKDVSDEDKLFKWSVQRDEEGFVTTVKSMQDILDNNHLSKEDVKLYLMSQLSRKNILRVQEALQEHSEKFPLVGAEFGYTGTTSPFITLEKSLREGRVNKGDYLIFWSLGAGITASTVLWRF